MKIGIITDLHNNVVALKAIMQKFISEHCDKIICCGDIIGIGPYPEQTVQYVMSIPNIICVRGNHENYLINGVFGKMSDEEILFHNWEHFLLSEKSYKFIESLSNRIDLTLESRKVSVLHYAMNKKGGYKFKPNPTENELLELFSEIDSEIILFGHDHNRIVRHIGNKWFINVGSLGCPGADINIARGAVLIIKDNNIEVKFVDEQYDVDSVIKDIKRLNYPAANEVLNCFYGVK